MKRVIRSSFDPRGKRLEEVFSEDDKNYVRLIYDVYKKDSRDGKYYKEYQERTDYMPIYDALYSYGDWNYWSAYTAGFANSPDGDDTWYKTDVWIYSSDHPEMTHLDEAIKYDMLGPVGENYVRSHLRNLYEDTTS